MKEYTITLPIAGHAVVTVEAESEEEAIKEAFNTVTIDDIQEWEALRQFNRGNVCYCPSPWEIQVDVYEEEEPTTPTESAE